MVISFGCTVPPFLLLYSVILFSLPSLPSSLFFSPNWSPLLPSFPSHSPLLPLWYREIPGVRQSSTRSYPNIDHSLNFVCSLVFFIWFWFGESGTSFLMNQPCGKCCLLLRFWLCLIHFFWSLEYSFVWITLKRETVIWLAKVDVIGFDRWNLAINFMNLSVDVTIESFFADYKTALISRR